jgi:hypothetical protein
MEANNSLSFLERSKKCQIEVKDRNFFTYVLSLTNVKISGNQESDVKTLGKVLRDKKDINTAIKLASFSKENEVRVFKGHKEGEWKIYAPRTFQEALIVA